MKQVVIGLRGTNERLRRELDQARHQATRLRRALGAIRDHRHVQGCDTCQALIDEALGGPTHE